jgi:hypothetical protein
MLRATRSTGPTAQRAERALCATAALAASMAASAAVAQTSPALLPIRVDLTANDGARTVAASEAFALERAPDGRAALATIGPDGNVRRVAARLERDGEIVTQTPDQMLACYNLALATIDALRRSNGRARIPIDATFSGTPIPLTVEATPGPNSANALDRAVSLAGETDGALIARTNGARLRTMVAFEGQLVVRETALRSAVFTISTFAGVPLRAVGGTTCTIDATPLPISEPAQRVDATV